MKDTPKRIAVIGLGTFGSSLARELVEQGADVMGIDMMEEPVESIKNDVNNAICFDCTSEALLMSHGVMKLDLVVVSIGGDFGATVTITAILKERGVRVYSRARTNHEVRILKAVGADMVYRPEHDQGIINARAITYTGIKEYVSLRGDMEIIVMPPSRQMIGKKLLELDIRRSHGINIAFFGKYKSNGDYDYRIPLPEDVMEEGDLLWLIGDSVSLKKYRNL
jgi:trk system potassium uptake protein